MVDELSNEQVEQIASLLRGNKRIEAIKVYRQATGKGLKEAHDFIEAIIPKRQEQDPEAFAGVPTRRSGCGPAVLLVVVVASGALFWLLESLA